MKNILPYIALIMMIVIVLLQNKGCFDNRDVTQDTITNIDTVYITEHIRDTVPGKPVYIKTKVDTSIWIKKSDYKPDTTYVGLLSQYKRLGNKHFSTNVFRTEFPIDTFGTVTVLDSIRENNLTYSELMSNLNIPTTIITKEKIVPQPVKRQLFVGTTITGRKYEPVSGVYGGFLYKNKKDKIYGISIGYTGNIEYGGSLYFPIKIK